MFCFIFCPGGGGVASLFVRGIGGLHTDAMSVGGGDLTGKLVRGEGSSHGASCPGGGGHAMQTAVHPP